MTDILAAGSTWLAGKRKAIASKAVSYARDSDSVALNATKTGRRDSLLSVPEPMQTQIQEMDWLIDAVDLVVGGDLIVPKDGDTITETLDGSDFIWKAFNTGTEACWRWDDRNNATYRIHTKLI